MRLRLLFLALVFAAPAFAGDSGSSTFRPNPTGPVMTSEDFLESTLCRGPVHDMDEPSRLRICAKFVDWRKDNAGRPRDQWSPLRLDGEDAR